MTKQGLLANRYRLWGANGRRLLAEMPLDGSYRLRVDSLVDLIASFDTEVRALDKEIASWLAGDVGFDAIQAIRGVGPVLGAVFVAEIGDVTRFPDARHLCSWAGLTPRHRESDTKVRRGRISKMGSRMVRWAAIEAISRARDTSVAAIYQRVAARRGTNVARVAAARKLLQLVYFGLRDGEIRCLAEAS